MANKLIHLCPDCGASIEIEKGRSVGFCTYCGAKIPLGNEKIIRHINEAEITRAETEKIIQLKELEEKAEAHDEFERKEARTNIIKKSFLYTLLVLISLGLLSELLLYFTGNIHSFFGIFCASVIILSFLYLIIIMFKRVYEIFI